MAQIEYSSIFGDLTKNVQIRFDAVSAMNKRLFDSVIVENFLDWDAPTIGLNFEEILGQYNISVVAPTIGDGSKEAIMGTNGMQTFANKTLKHAINRPMTMQTYRKILQLLDSKMVGDDAKKNELIKTMWGEVTSTVEAVYGKLDMIFLGALSNEGKFTFDNTTNPEGGVKETLDFNQPASNIANAKVAWDASNIGTVDCFEDIQGIIDAANDKVVFDKILLDPTMLSYICRANNTRKMIWGSDKASKIVMLADLNEYMRSNGLPVFEPIRRNVRVQNGQTTTTLKAFNEKNLVFVPAGKLGVIKNAYADSELKPENGVSYSNFGRIRVSQWGVGETQGSNSVEYTKAEVNALPVITEFNGIYTLKAKQ